MRDGGPAGDGEGGALPVRDGAGDPDVGVADGDVADGDGGVDDGDGDGDAVCGCGVFLPGGLEPRPGAR